MSYDLTTINSAFEKAAARCQQWQNIIVSISGGSDSDVMLDLLLQVCPKEKLHLVFFDTGIEYSATKSHLYDLEKKYNITIDRQHATVPVPIGCKKYGVPFLSKFVSQMISRLQRHNFDFANDGNKSFEELKEKYPKCVGALTWWTNSYPAMEGKKSRFNINSDYALKEFLIATPPTFAISAECCEGAKKSSSRLYERENNFDCKCVGLRRAEGGIRANSIKNCYTFDPKATTQNFRPIWWFTDEDKAVYIDKYNVRLSDCYTLYGMKRTGCAGCPFNSHFEDDLLTLQKYEPKLYTAVNNIFGESYNYMRKYREYKKHRRKTKDEME
jgi:3'-phosphoadenosine 5'-phosphosulfate sulfotransferase (PAPS reductase)/FAD synthetase